MKLRAFLTAGLIIAGVTGPSFAFEGMLLSGNGGIHADRLLQAVSCNVNDEQTLRDWRLCDCRGSFQKKAAWNNVEQKAISSRAQ